MVSLSYKHSMEDEGYSADSPRSAGSDPSDSRSGFKLSAKLKARMEKLSDWQIDPALIRFPDDLREFSGGHATVSKAFLLDEDRDNEDHEGKDESYNSEEELQRDSRSSGSDDRIREAVDHGPDGEGGHGDEEKDEAQEQDPNGDNLWRGKIVAVKKTRIADNIDMERALELALRETEFLVQLFHPNIVKLEGFVEDLFKNKIWLVFPWAQNGNLKDFVASRDWEIPERISLIDDVARGLEYLHSLEPPIRHGDLKSLNVLVNSEHRAVITDFGSARRATEQNFNNRVGQVQNQPQSTQSFQATFCAVSETITLTGNVYTLRWAAPELLNDDQINLWSDIWALGWIAYEVMTNCIPFQDVPADAVVVSRVIQGDLPSITDHARMSLLRELCSLMNMCWNSNPTERPTAEHCRKAVYWMPKIVPNSTRGPVAMASSVRSPELLMQLGYMYQRQSDYANALNCFTESLRICTNIGDSRGRADALFSLAEVHRAQNKFSEAIPPYSEALQVSTDIGDGKGRADALWGLAQVHRVRREYRKAFTLYSEAIKIRYNIGSEKYRASAVFRLAEVNRLRKDYRAAITLYSKVLQIRTDDGDRKGRADALLGLAKVHQLRKEDSEAIALYTEVLQIRTDIGDRNGRADALLALAEVRRLRNEHSEAITLYTEVLQIRTDVGDRKGIADALLGLAEVHRLRKDYSKASTVYSEVLQIYDDIGDKKGRVVAFVGLAGREALMLYSALGLSSAFILFSVLRLSSTLTPFAALALYSALTLYFALNLYSALVFSYGLACFRTPTFYSTPAFYFQVPRALQAFLDELLLLLFEAVLA